MSDTVSNKKQSVTGFRVVNYASKRTKSAQKFRIVLEAEVDDVGAGAFDMGDFQKALLHHQDSEMDVGLSVFMDKKEKE